MGHYTSFTIAITQPANTKTTMAICIQIHVGFMGGPSGRSGGPL